MWMNHHAVMGPVDEVDHRSLTATVGLLLCIAFASSTASVALFGAIALLCVLGSSSFGRSDAGAVTADV